MKWIACLSASLVVMGSNPFEVEIFKNWEAGKHVESSGRPFEKQIVFCRVLQQYESRQLVQKAMAIY